ncbi:hypothetical protein [Pedobacter sp.]|uniref:hypothetical protein n=1 Tax=Pedobacter sp. TaxID=1411316 RepID=UPI003BAC4553
MFQRYKTLKGFKPGFEYRFNFLNPTVAKILLKCSKPGYAALLRHEASATNETDASCLSRVEVVLKDCSEWREQTLILAKALLSK